MNPKVKSYEDGIEIGSRNSVEFPLVFIAWKNTLVSLQFGKSNTVQFGSYSEPAAINKLSLAICEFRGYSNKNFKTKFGRLFFQLSAQMMLMQITRTSVTKNDEPFLFALYSETRAEEMALVPWDDGQRDAFLQHQFQAQHQHYSSKYKDASFQIIKSDGVPVGRLYTAELADEFRIIDILILSEFRGKKIGTTLIEEILHGADQKNKAVQIYLDTNDRSASLFARLGFAPVADEGVYRLWQRTANSRTETADA